MKRFAIAILVLLCCAPKLRADGPTTRQVETFELTPSPPSVNYWLLTNPADSLRGNADVLYADAAATLNDEIRGKVDDALAAYTSDPSKFDALAAEAENVKVYSKLPGTFDLLAVAGRREFYRWDSSFREQGGDTLLPHLGNDRALGRLIAMHALRQIRAGQFDDAVNTLRLGFELGRKIGTEPILISGLVGLAVLGQTADATMELMKQPNSPNLYWAFAGMPHPMITLQEALGGEMIDVPATFPEISSQPIQNITGDQSRTIYHRIVEYLEKDEYKNPDGTRPWADPKAVAGEIDRDLPPASQFYSEKFHVSADQVRSLDPYKIVISWWYCNLRTDHSQFWNISALPYPQLFLTLGDLAKRMQQEQEKQPCNVFLIWASSVNPSAQRYMRMDRELAALTDVEAIRSYAAANDDKAAGESGRHH